MPTDAESAPEATATKVPRSEGALSNWSSTVRFHPERFEQPTTLSALTDVVAGSGAIRVVGTAHSFSAIADTPGTLISTLRLPKILRFDPDGTVHVSASVTYGELAAFLTLNGRALHNMGSLPHISVVGAIATGTHGSGDTNQILAGAVTALSFIASTGQTIHLDRHNPDFGGSVVALGALGCVTEVALETIPTYNVQQDAYHGVGWDETVDALDTVMASGHSVSVFTDWVHRDVTEILVKRIPSAELDDDLPDVLARRGADARGSLFTQTTTGVPVDWDRALPHFRSDLAPSAGGDEIQSEYFVSRSDAVPALNAIRRIGPLLSEHLHISELRTIGADNFWMSGSYEQAALGIHFTWKRHPQEVASLVHLVEEALSPFNPRPHWGKLASDRAFESSAAVRPKLADFADLIHRFDPRGAFRNTFIRRVLGNLS